VFRNYFGFDFDYYQSHRNYYLVIVVKFQINHNFAIGYFTTIHTVIIGFHTIGISFTSFIVVGHSPFIADPYSIILQQTLSRSYSIRTLTQMDYHHPDSVMVPLFQTGRNCLSLVRNPWASLVLQFIIVMLVEH